MILFIPVCMCVLLSLMMSVVMRYGDRCVSTEVTH